MDYEALKEQWSEVEDRDGVRLSWNVFPSTRMVSLAVTLTATVIANPPAGSLAPCCSHRSSLHTSQGKARHPSAAV